MKKYVEIGKRLKELRGDLSQKEFAKKIGVSFRAYQNYETGERVPPGPALSKITRVCKTTESWILSGTKSTAETFVHSYKHFKKAQELHDSKGAIPKAAISDDEMAIIKTLRLLKNSTGILKKVFDEIEADPDEIISGYNLLSLKKINLIIKKGGFEKGVDFEEFIWGYEKVLGSDLWKDLKEKWKGK